MPEVAFSDARILIVDDELANVRLLEKLLQQAGYSQLTSTTDSRQVLSLAEQIDPDLILLDLRMPHRDGFAVLEELRPKLESGYLPVLVLTADLAKQTKERALSSGVKDFLTKPLDATETLLRIRNLLQTRFLYLEERVLLQQTLQGSIGALTDVLALVNPAGFSRAVRARDMVGKLLVHLDAAPNWEVEVAAMLSQLGSVVLPPDTVERHYEGKQLTHSESVAVSRMPKVAEQVIARIPRMGEVARILEYQNARFDGTGSGPDAPTGADLPFGSRILKIVLDLDVLETRGVPEEAAMEMLLQRRGWYDPELLQAVAMMRAIDSEEQQVAEIAVSELRAGMVLAEDIRSVTEILVVARGQEISDRIVERLRNSGRLLHRHQRVHVILRKGGSKESE